MNKIKIIAAIGKNYELGKDNKLIWNLPKDLIFFKNQTMGKTIVMGYNTYKSLPKLLPNRKHIVLTHKIINNSEVKTFNNFKDLLEYIKIIDDDVYIIGGESIYKLFIDIADEIILTEIDDTRNADVYFPKFDKNKFNICEIDMEMENNVKYKHVKYLRK